MTAIDRTYTYRGSHRAIVVSILIPEFEGGYGSVMVCTERYVKGVPHRYLEERATVDMPVQPTEQQVWQAVHDFAARHLAECPSTESRPGTPSGGGEGGGDVRYAATRPDSPQVPHLTPVPR